MTKGTFKVADNSDGSSTMWYSSGARLTRVVWYAPDYFSDWTELEINQLQTLHAQIFMRGLKRGSE